MSDQRHYKTAPSPHFRIVGERQIVLRRLSHDPIFLTSTIVLILIIFASFGASLIANYILHTSPTKQNLNDPLVPWFSSTNILGTDELGRDVLTRTLFAGQVSLTIGLAVALLQLSIGVSLGLVAGYYGGRIDDIVNATLQIVRGLPIFFLLIILSVLFQPTVFGLSIILGSLGWVDTCRQIRAHVFSSRQREYVEAARSIGAQDRRILVRHILPNVSFIALTVAGFDVASAILTEASLSFLGFGVQPPTPSWGNMLSGALIHINDAPWLTVIPGFFIMVTVLCIFLFSDGLRDALDPQI